MLTWIMDWWCWKKKKGEPQSSYTYGAVALPRLSYEDRAKQCFWARQSARHRYHIRLQLSNHSTFTSLIGHSAFQPRNSLHCTTRAWQVHAAFTRGRNKRLKFSSCVRAATHPRELLGRRYLTFIHFHFFTVITALGHFSWRLIRTDNATNKT